MEIFPSAFLCLLGAVEVTSGSTRDQQEEDFFIVRLGPLSRIQELRIMSEGPWERCRKKTVRGFNELNSSAVD